ncbi:MAG TPA: ROK family protein [Rubrobacteraceae bacterium]
MNAIGVDVGGTKIAAAVVTPEGEILNEVRYPSSGPKERLLSSIARSVNEVRDGFEVGGVCLAVPGTVSTEENKIIDAPNLHAIEGIPLKDELEERTGLTTTVENDANAAAWGEFRFGAGSEVSHLIFITLGTGVGGGVISHGVLLRGAQGAGGEMGHITIQATGPRCGCGNHGCLEALASGTAIARRAREVASEKPDSALGQLAVERAVLGEDVAGLARQGDEAAISVLRETGVWLGIGLAGFVNVFNPEVIAIGGGAARAGDLILDAARHEVRLRAMSPSRDLVEINEATLGAESGVLGAAALARNSSSGEYVLGTL